MGQMELWEDSIWVNGTIDTETGIPGENKEGEAPHFYTKEKIKVREGECILKKEGGTGKIHAMFFIYDKDKLLKVDGATPMLEESHTFNIPSGNELYLRVMVEGEKESKDFANGGSLTISNRGIKGDIIYGIDAKKNKREIGDFSFLDTTQKENLVEATNEVLSLTNQAMEKANQAFQFANDGKSKLAAAIGNGATASMTWDQLAKLTDQIKLQTKKYTYVKCTASGNPQTNYHIVSEDVSIFRHTVAIMIEIECRSGFSEFAFWIDGYIVQQYDMKINIKGELMSISTYADTPPLKFGIYVVGTN